MGQQQLLLLVLGIVIVGLAVVVGIQAFSENQEKANQDALVNDAVRIVSDAQAWALKPSAFGGGEGEFTGATLDILGYDTGSNDYYSNINGEFLIFVSGGSPGSFAVGACDATGGNKTSVVATGFDQEDIVTLTTGIETLFACPGE